MPINSIILRTLPKPPLVTKGIDLDYLELDGNFAAIYDAIVALNAAVGVGVLTLQGGYDPTATSLYPTSANTALADAPQKGYVWYITVAGTINGHSVQPGAVVFARVNAAADNVDASWVIVESTINMTTLFTAWAMSLPGYDNTKVRALTTKGDGTDTFLWTDILIP